MKSILLIEDDPILGETLVDCFTVSGYKLLWARSAAEALAIVDQNAALALIDVTLPDGNGFELAMEIARKTSLPFIFMTARNEAESRLRGFELGAFDYVPKPFHFKELLIRVEKILSKSAQASQVSLGTVRIGSRVVDRRAQSIFAEDGSIVPLSQKDFAVLSYLIQHTPRIVSRDELLDQIWGEDQFPTPRTVDNSIVRIRKALLDLDGDLIHSIRGHGYQIHQGSIQIVRP